MTINVDYSAPLEVVDERSGQVFPGKLQQNNIGTWTVLWSGSVLTRQHRFFANGNPVPGSEGNGWRVRNVAVSRQSVPEHPTPTQYAPELVERAFALVRFIADTPAHKLSKRETIIEAVSIVSDLPQEVDPDLIEARRIAANYDDGTGYFGTDEITRATADGIARGRQLQRGEAA